jgi:uncharacterized protein
VKQRGKTMGDMSREPSMEEILSSIRRVIARDEPSQTVAPVAALQNVRDDEEDILDLTDTSTDDEDDTEVVSPFAGRVKAEPAAAPLLAEEPAAASRQSLDVLAAMLAGGAVETPAATPAEGDMTVNALVEAALRPMLKSWLDTNLPGVVERLVAREIARITGTRL